MTAGPEHHFFGYYEKSPWDASGRYLLALEVEFGGEADARPPTSEDVAGICLVDTADGNALERLDETTAWNWQQGTMLQWVPGAADREIVYNVRAGDRFGAVIRDVFSGEYRILPRPVYAMNPAGGSALSDNFARIAHSRPGYGYAPGEAPAGALSVDFERLQEARPVVGYAGHVGTSEALLDDPAPEDDGVYSMDLRAGRSGEGACRLIVSLARAAALRARPDMDGAFHWINHVQWNTDGTRFAFLHRWKGPATGNDFFTRLVTADADGSELHILADEGMTSHYDWRDADHVLAWARLAPAGMRYYLLRDHVKRDGSLEAELVGESVFTCDGHCSYSFDREWILTDTYPDPNDSKRTLILYHPETDRRVDIGRFFAPSALTGEIRCDLHPRWSRDGRQVCFDSAHEGTRQMYVTDVSEIVCG